MHSGILINMPNWSGDGRKYGAVRTIKPTKTIAYRTKLNIIEAEIYKGFGTLSSNYVW